MKQKYAFIIFILLSLLLSCGKSEKTYTVEIKDGVKHIHNNAPLWGEEQKINLELVRKIGGPDEKNENYMLFKPCDLEVDGDGNIYVLDGGNYRIMKYDKEWNFIKSFGQRGEGPGELRDYQLTSQLGGNKLFIIDDRYNIITVFDTDGNFLRNVRYDKFGSDFGILSTGELLTNGVRESIVENRNQGNLKEGDISLIYVKDLDGNKIREFGKAKIYTEINANSRGNFFTIAVDTNDSIYVSFMHQNRIEKYSPAGELLFRIIRDLPFMESTKIETMMRNVFSRGIYIDNKGRIWVLGLKSQTSSKVLIEELILEVYNPEGILLTRVPSEVIPSLQKLQQIHGDRVFFIDTYIQMCVYEYKIVEK